MTQPTLNIVLHQPEIPQNAGNIGRTCVAIGARLWMIRPLGFRLEDRYLKRAGMDYWQHLDWEVADSFEEVQAKLPDARVWCLTKTASRLVWEVEYRRGDILLFGSESRGLPASILQHDAVRNLKLPMTELVRSLNLASTVNTVAYEAIRQMGGIPADILSMTSLSAGSTSSSEAGGDQ
jgi:tRNA (cytidine/uridine-2'-O-)-methyltransferase